MVNYKLSLIEEVNKAFLKICFFLTKRSLDKFILQWPILALYILFDIENKTKNYFSRAGRF